MSDDATLLALEQRTTALIDAQVRSLIRRAGDILVAGLAAAGALTAIEILSRHEVDAGLAAAVTGAQTATETILTGGYQAGARTATARVDAELAALDLTRGDATVNDPGHLAGIIAAAAAAYATLRANIARRFIEGFTAGAPALAREAVATAVRTLNVHLRALGAVVVHRGYTDTQVGLYRALAATHTFLRLRKRWVNDTSARCPSCRALHGTVIDLDADFDATASDDPAFTPPKVYITMAGPPRHPNCRCRLAVEPSSATSRLAQALGAPVPGNYTYLSAADIRRMASPTYKALVKFLTAILTKLRQLIAKVAGGQ